MNTMTSEAITLILSEEADHALKAALHIGQTLCETAFWDDSGQHCNWMGRTLEDLTTFTNSSAALGSNLYGGSAGIALFLSDLYRQVPEPDFKHTASAALRRSIRHLKNSPEYISPLSFFSGQLGLADVVARFREDDLEPGLDEDLQLLLEQVAGALNSQHALDVINGNAGAIPALLWLARRPGLERLRDLALACGEELCHTAKRTSGLCYWEANLAGGPGFNSPPLTGLSHGASGMALALLELYAEARIPDFLETARGAFAYEDSLFNPDQGNWLDLRQPFSNAGGVLTGTFATAWCHGAPGIALARLCAMRLDSERAEQHEAMARIALTTTISALERNLASPRFDATLCHGLTGLSEVVLIFAEAFDDDNLRATVTHTVEELIQRYGASGDWPSGIPGGGPNPSLMTGTAGIGHHFLRVHCPQQVPPILLPALT
jgi:lantibiotic biosynthesis protein